MQFKCVQDLEGHLSIGREVAIRLTPELTPSGMLGDITINGFHLGRDLKGNPMKIAADVSTFLESHDDVASVEVAKAFVNVTLKPEALFRDTIVASDPLDATLPSEELKTYLVEYSAPNTNKPMHLGHIRNNSLGLAICRILEAVGHTVKPVNLVNDRGIHICKSMLAYSRYGEGQTPESTGKKGDHLVGDYYVRFEQAFQEEIAALKSGKPELKDKSSEDLFLETAIGREVQQMLKDWESGKPEVRALWRKMNDWVLAGFASTYDRMGVQFERTFFESDTYTLGKDIVQEGLDKGVFEKTEDGATQIDLTDIKLDKKVVLRRDGTSVYVTQDLGTTLMKYEEFKPDSMIWIVGNEQIYHFQVLFAILQRLGYPWAHDVHHLAYGMVNLPEGKMKSREGTVVDADDLFDEVFQQAKLEIEERAAAREEELPGDVMDRAEAIAMGAIKFMLLRVNPKTTMKFDPKASINPEGDTGPYVQYACARVSSIFRRAGVDPESVADVDWSLLTDPRERDVALRISMFSRSMQQSAQLLDPARLANYLLDLSKSFNSFYQYCPVLKADSEPLKRSRLALCEQVRRVLSRGLEVMTIQTVESM